MADVILDRDGAGGSLAQRFRETSPGVYAPEVAAIPVQAAPASADVVGGRAAVAGGEVLRVPAGRAWRGQLHLAVSASAAVAAAAAVRAGRLDLAGAGATPTPGTVLEVAVALPVTTATATAGASGGGVGSLTLVIIAGGVDAVLTLQGDATALRASARGELIG